MKIEYNIEKPTVVGRGGLRKSEGENSGGRPLSEEMQAVIDFINSDEDNIVFTFEDSKVARNKGSVMRRTAKSRGIQIIISQRQNQLFIEREPEGK